MYYFHYFSGTLSVTVYPVWAIRMCVQTRMAARWLAVNLLITARRCCCSTGVIYWRRGASYTCRATWDRFSSLSKFASRWGRTKLISARRKEVSWARSELKWPVLFPQLRFSLYLMKIILNVTIAFQNQYKARLIETGLSRLWKKWWALISRRDWALSLVTDTSGFLKWC